MNCSTPGPSTSTGITSLGTTARHRWTPATISLSCRSEDSVRPVPWSISALERASRNAHEGWTRDELETHIRTEFSTFNWLLEPMLERAGFAIEDVIHAPSQVFSKYVCRKR